MINIIIDEKIKEILKDKIAMGCLEANVRVKESSTELWEEILLESGKIANENSLEEVLKIANIKAAREGYKKLGKDPSRYRVSSESLARRIVKGNELYKVNNIVDINNLISIRSFHPVCAYDIDKIDGDVLLTIGREGDSYEGIGRGQINLSNLPVFRDNGGNFGSTTSDSIRAMVTEETRRLSLNIVSFNGKEDLEKNIEYCKELLEKYAEGCNISSRIIY